MFSGSVLTGMSVFIGVFACILVSGFYLLFRSNSDQRKTRERLRDLAASPVNATRKLWSIDGAIPKFLKMIAIPAFTKQAQVGELRKSFLHAGYFHPNAPLIFLGVKSLLTVMLPILSIIVCLWFSTKFLNKPSSSGEVEYRFPSWTKLTLFALVGGGVGTLAPSFWLSTQVKKRQQLLRHALPDALDMLVLCLEGGVSFSAAMQRVTDELQIVHPVLGMELTIVQREIQLGLTAGDALRKFADRCGLSDVRDLALVLLQSERYGASITKTLRTYAEGARQDRHQKAEEVAQKAAVKILFPTLLCIFPAIFIVILGPAAFQIAKLFSR